MPMPPMPTKWIGPISRGSFMRQRPRDQRRISALAVSHQPPACTRSASRSAASSAPAAWRGLGHGGEPCRIGGKRGDLRRQPFGRELVLARRMRAAGPLQHAGIGVLVLIERVRQRHQDGGPADRAQARPPSRRRSARPPDGSPPSAPAGRRRTARPRAPTLQLGIGLAHARQILVARLLHDHEPLRSVRLEPLDRGRHDVGHDARALAAAEHEQAQRAARRRAPRRASPRPRSPSAAPDCRCSVALAASFGSLVEHAGEAGRDRGDAARQQAVGAAHHGVLLVDQRRDAAQRRREHRRDASDSRRSRPPPPARAAGS